MVRQNKSFEFTTLTFRKWNGKKHHLKIWARITSEEISDSDTVFFEKSLINTPIGNSAQPALAWQTL